VPWRSTTWHLHRDGEDFSSALQARVVGATFRAATAIAWDGTAPSSGHHKRRVSDRIVTYDDGGTELAAGTLGKIVDGRVEPVQAKALSVPDDGHDESVVDGHGDADVDGLAPPVAFVGPVSIEVGELAQSLHASLGHVGHVAQGHALT
jgi:hypothetical protein